MRITCSFCSKAFTLVEVTLALGIGAIGLIAIFGLLPAATRANRDASSQLGASEILSAVVADLRSTPKTSTSSPQYAITFGQPTTLYLDAAGQTNSSPQSQSTYRLTVTFPTSPTGVVYADIAITWPAVASQSQATGSVEPLSVFNRN